MLIRTHYTLMRIHLLYMYYITNMRNKHLGYTQSNVIISVKLIFPNLKTLDSEYFLTNQLTRWQLKNMILWQIWNKKLSNVRNLFKQSFLNYPQIEGYSHDHEWNQYFSSMMLFSVGFTSAVLCNEKKLFGITVSHLWKYDSKQLT